MEKVMEKAMEKVRRFLRDAPHHAPRRQTAIRVPGAVRLPALTVLLAVALLLAAGANALSAQEHGAADARVQDAQDAEEMEIEEHHRLAPPGIFSAEGPINTDPDGIALHGYDVVAYYIEGRPMKGSPEYEVEYRDAVFRFASSEHRDRFREDPQAFMPAYGGYCALGVANGYKDGMHPEAFEIVDGRLFFNLTPEIHRFWEGSRDALIRRADANWSRVKDSDRFGPGIGPIR